MTLKTVMTRIASYLTVFLPLTFASATGSASELRIETLQDGTGEIAGVGQKVSVHYKGQLEDGSVFDASRDRGQPFSFILGAGQVIKGWEQGVAGMRVGETRRLTIPPELGYGARGAGGVIPPNTTLTFEIELLGVSTPVTLGQATPQELLDVQAEGVVIIDIRRKSEWKETGIIDGAETVTAFTQSGRLHKDFQQKFTALAPTPDTPILLYCRTGNRTASLGQALINQLGFTNVTHLTSGIVGWKKSGFDTVPYQGD